MAGNQQQRTDFVSNKVLAVYDKVLLDRAVLHSMWDKWGMVKTVPANSNTKKAFVMRYKGILPATTVLAEYNGTIKNPNKVVREEVEYEVAHYGDYIRYTDELDLYDYRNMKSDFLDLQGDQANLTVETLRRDVLRTGTNVVFAGGNNRTQVGSNGTTAAQLATALDKAILKLKSQNGKKLVSSVSGSTTIGTKPIRNCYIGVCSIYGTEALREMDGWDDVETYAPMDSDKIDGREVGRYKDIRFLEGDNEEGIDDGHGNIIEQTIILAANAYVTTTLRGKKGIATKIKPLGSSGASDPLDQFGTVGWTAICGTKIVNEAWMVRVEHKSSFAVNDQKHFLDYS